MTKIIFKKLKDIYRHELLFKVQSLKEADENDRQETKAKKKNVRKADKRIIRTAFDNEAELSGSDKEDSNSLSSNSSESELESDSDSEQTANEYDSVKYIYIYVPQYTDDRNSCNVADLKDRLLQDIHYISRKYTVFHIENKVFKDWCISPFETNSTSIEIKFFNFTLRIMISNLLSSTTISKLVKAFNGKNKSKYDNSSFADANENWRLLLSAIFYYSNDQIKHEISKVFESVNIVCPIDETTIEKTCADFETYVLSKTKNSGSGASNLILVSLKNLKNHFVKVQL